MSSVYVSPTGPTGNLGVAAATTDSASWQAATASLRCRDAPLADWPVVAIGG